MSDPEMLRTAFYAMKRDAAPGVDGMTWETYEQDLDRRIDDLHARVHSRSVPGTAVPPELYSEGRRHASARSRLPRSKTRSSRERWRRC